MAKSTKKNKVKIEPEGQAHIQASFNNIIISITNNKGQVISWSSAGKMGFKGSKKIHPYAAQVAAEDCARIAIDLGLKKSKSICKRSWSRSRICYQINSQYWTISFRNS